MHRLFIIITLAMLMLFACKSQADKRDARLDVVQEQSTEVANKHLKLDAQNVDGFELATMIPIDTTSKYTFKEVTETVNEEGEESTVSFYDAYLDGSKHFRIVRGYDFRTDTYLDIFREIIVQSDLYQTDKGIGVGSTVAQFKSAYPDAKAYFSYVGDAFWLVNDNEMYQFFIKTDLDKTNYMETDMELVPWGDLDPNSTIYEIRFFDKDF